MLFIPFVLSYSSRGLWTCLGWLFMSFGLFLRSCSLSGDLRMPQTPLPWSTSNSSWKVDLRNKFILVPIFLRSVQFFIIWISKNFLKSPHVCVDSKISHTKITFIVKRERDLYIHSKGRMTERERRCERSLPSLVHSPASCNNWDWARPSQEPRTPSSSPMWVLPCGI